MNENDRAASFSFIGDVGGSIHSNTTDFKGSRFSIMEGRIGCERGCAASAAHWLAQLEFQNTF
jgi:hypothetical protein